MPCNETEMNVEVLVGSGDGDNGDAYTVHFLRRIFQANNVNVCACQPCISRTTGKVSDLQLWV